AASVAGEAGADVTLVEREKALGGQVLLAEKLPNRSEFGGAATNLTAEAKRAGVDIRTGTEFTSEHLDELRPDLVVGTTDSSDRDTDFENLDSPRVLTARQYLVDTPELPQGGVLIADWRGD